MPMSNLGKVQDLGLCRGPKEASYPNVWDYAEDDVEASGGQGKQFPRLTLRLAMGAISSRCAVAPFS